MRILFSVFLVLGIFVLSGMRPAAASGVQLLYFFSHGCEYCELWDEEVGSIYNKTTEGRGVPLRRVNADELPSDLSHFDNIAFTPTFVVVKDGKEVGRLLGYMGQDFFWGYLGLLIKKAKAGARVSPQAQLGLLLKPQS